MASFEAASDCTVTLAPTTPGGTSPTVPANHLGPFASTTNAPIGIFQEVNGTWTMDDEGGVPFPCPAPEGDTPGPGNGALPAAVFAVWGLQYATNCSFVGYSPQPG